MATKLFDSTIVAGAEQAVDFIGNILESSTEYSIIGKDLEGKILLWNQEAREWLEREPRLFGSSSRGLGGEQRVGRLG